MLKECAPESQKSPKRVRKSGFRLFSDSFETPGRTLWALLGPFAGVLFPDSSGVPGPKGPGDPVWGGADRKINTKKAQETKKAQKGGSGLFHNHDMLKLEGFRAPRIGRPLKST